MTHHLHREVAELIHEGESDTAIARRLGVHRRTAATVREGLGVRPYTRVTSVESKLSRFSVPLEGGHTGWTGRTSASGGPLIRHRGTEMSAIAIAFARHHGRPPVGMVKADCGVRHCLTGAHVLDEQGRLALRLQLRALDGRRAPWDVCHRGHPWVPFGRVEPDLSLYCAACSDDRKAVSDLRKRGQMS